ncbi:MAG: ABC transporter permease, partial [Bacteroidia bacterium]
MFKVIFKREYFNIVKKRAFWLTTFLLPLGMALLMGLQIVAQLFVEKESYKVWVIKEQTSTISPALVATKDIEYVFTEEPLEQLKLKIQDKSNEIVLKLPDADLLDKKEISFTLYHGKGNISEPILEKIRRRVKEGVQSYKQSKAGVSKEQLEAMNFNLASNTVQFSKDGSKKSNTYLAMGVAGTMNTMMYMLLAIYGGILMQSVIEEKSNRIVEIIVSSVDPFQLMLGKTVAVAIAGLTQFLLWGILSIGAVFVLSLFAGTQQPPNLSTSGIDEVQAENMVMEMMIAIKNFNWSVLYYFPFYFLGGFFLYGSIYAGAASLVDNPQDAQQFV